MNEMSGSASGAGRRLARGVCRLLADHGYRTLCELTLVDGRRVDVFALDRRGGILIVEVKTSLADYRADSKWPDYLASCDRFAFAVPAAFPVDILPGEVGIIVADAFGGAFVRPPRPEAPIAAARRKALTIRFARTAAARLQMCMDAPTADPLLR
ncbi:MAG: MmcB family DNA repair protein [Rhodospirillales bacterium]|nr:MmcB family DNA repair protein [Rhodospirillales bacterium]